MQPLRLLDSSNYRLESVRSSKLTLDPHPAACAVSDLSKYHQESSNQPLAVDLFCGAGGLSLGLRDAGFNVVLGVDRDPFAIETHRAHFGGASVVADISDESVL